MASSQSREAFSLCLFMIMISLQYLTLFCSTTSAARLLLVHDDDQEEDLITKTCNHTLYFELCISSLRSDPRTSQKSDLKGLAVIALDLSINKANQSLSYVNHLRLTLSSSNYTQYESNCLTDCNEEMSEGIENLLESSKALINGSLDDVNDFVSSAMTNSQTCNECFDEDQDWGNTAPTSTHAPDEEGISTLTAINQDFYKLSSNFLAITILFTQ